MRRARIPFLALLPFLWLAPPAVHSFAQGSSTLETSALRITLAPGDASITVTQKNDGFVWHQEIRPGFKATLDSNERPSNSLKATVTGDGQAYQVTLSTNPESPDGFDLELGIAGKRYVTLPAYPFLFQVPAKGWYYVQNTSGEGMLMPLDKAGDINKEFSWSGSQPWWGLTDLKRSMAARLDSFRNPDGHPTPEDRTAYAVPLHIHYSFHSDGGYVGLAKEYRAYFLRAHADLTPLRERLQQRPALRNFADGIYVYLWGKDPAEDLSLVQEMKAAGIDHGIALFYGRREVSRELFAGIEKLGWTAGMYRMPAANLFRVSRNHGWVNAVLTGRRTAGEIYAESNPKAWDRVCGDSVLAGWLGKAKEAIASYGLQLFYFDTLVVQLAPCLEPSHPTTIEQNQQARLELMQKTQDLGMIVGSGEGLSPTWALPGLDYFEGLMSLRTYGDTRMRVAAGDYENDAGESYAGQAAYTLDEKRRIPLYQLGFHDYVAATWNWRDSNFLSSVYARKKELFNILYGTMPMFHISPKLWATHKADFVACYRETSSVRARLGFAEMTNHGWLTADRSVQFSDWSSGDRVIVNFGRQPYTLHGGATVPANSFRVERRP